jgi:hypothetical protein
MIALIVITSRRHTEFGEVWEGVGVGMGHELLSTAAYKGIEQ